MKHTHQQTQTDRRTSTHTRARARADTRESSACTLCFFIVRIIQVQAAAGHEKAEAVFQFVETVAMPRVLFVGGSLLPEASTALSKDRRRSQALQHVRPLYARTYPRVHTYICLPKDPPASNVVLTLSVGRGRDGGKEGGLSVCVGARARACVRACGGVVANCCRCC